VFVHRCQVLLLDARPQSGCRVDVDSSGLGQQPTFPGDGARVHAGASLRDREDDMRRSVRVSQRSGNRNNTLLVQRWEIVKFI
jgi:hypothetical protein